MGIQNNKECFQQYVDGTTDSHGLSLALTHGPYSELLIAQFVHNQIFEVNIGIAQ